MPASGRHGGWAPPGLGPRLAPMLLPSPFCPLTAAALACRIAGLKATVLLLLTLLIKAKIQIKTASAVGFFLLAVQTLAFLGLAGVALTGAVLAYPRRQARSA
jgi:hypothetical protein